MTLQLNNFSQEMDNRYQSLMSWKSVYMNMKEEVDNIAKKDMYYPLNKNYDSLFCYYMIEKKADLEEFKEVFACVQKKPDAMNRFYNNFFYVKEIEICAKSKNPFQKMNVVFLDESKDFKQLKNKEYFLAFLEGTRYIKSFNYGNPFALLSMVFDSPNDIQDIYKATQKNPLLETSSEHEYETFTHELLKTIAHHSKSEASIKAIGALKEVIEDFEEKFSEALCNHKSPTSTHKYQYLQIHSAFLNLADTCGLNIVSMLNIAYSKDYKEPSDGKTILWGNANCVAKVFEHDFKNPLDFDLSFDLTKSLGENFVYLKAFEYRIKNHLPVNLSSDSEDYIKEKISQSNSSVTDILDTCAINSYFQQLHLDNTLVEKTNAVKKLKI